MLESTVFEQIAKHPLSDSAPAGESVRYHETFAAMEAEIGKLENPAGGEVDWRLVENGCADLLTTKSKDVLLAVWLTRALWHRDGFVGLAAGLNLTRQMIETFWEAIHPQRIKPRRAALVWLGEKLESLIGIEQLTANLDSAEACAREIDALAAFLESRFEGEHCGLTGLAGRLRSVPRPTSAETTTPDESQTVSTAEAGGSVMSSGMSTGSTANRAQAVARLKELAQWWAKHEPSSPMVPLLNRAVTWSELEFEALFSQLLRNRRDAKEYMWDILGIEEPT